MVHTHKTTGNSLRFINCLELTPGWGARSRPLTCSERVEIKVITGNDTSISPYIQLLLRAASSTNGREHGAESEGWKLTVTDRDGGARAEKVQIRHELLQANNLQPIIWSHFPPKKQDCPSIWPGSPVVQWYIRTIKRVVCVPSIPCFFQCFILHSSCLLRSFTPMCLGFLQHVGEKKCNLTILLIITSKGCTQVRDN